MRDTFDLAERLTLAFESVPDHVLQAARLHLVDAIGVAVAATQAGPIPGVGALASGDDGPSTVLGTGRGSSAGIAALANGSLMHSLEYDDTHTASVVHGSSVLASAALAVAEQVAADGEDLVRAFAVGWELFVRIGLASPGRLQARGFQVTSAGGAFAAAAISALLHRDDRGTFANAIGIAGSQAGGTFAFLADGDTVKAAQAGWAAHSGVMAAELARAGVSGPRGVFDGPYGFYRLYAQDDGAGARLMESCESLGEVWHLPDAAFKLLPCCHYLHPFVEALTEALADGVQAEDVVSIHCEVPEEVVPIIAEPWPDRQAPARTQDARWSLPYVLGRVLRHGRLDATAFVGEVDQRVVAAARAISYEPWIDSGFPVRFPARLHLRLSDGSSRDVEVPDVLGGAGRPVSDEAVLGKARDNLAIGGMAAEDAEILIAAILGPDPDLVLVSSVLRSSVLRSPFAADGAGGSR